MSALIATVATILILIPTAPLLVYVIGLLLPASHIVSRTCTFRTTKAHLWQVLTDVESYPSWQQRVEQVTIIDNDVDEKRLTFEELTRRKKRISVIHVEQNPHCKLLRILEESSRLKTPTFSGSWTYELLDESQQQDSDLQRITTTLKITQQGLIQRPLVRVTQMLLLGFHLRIDIFLKDLQNKIEKDLQNRPPVELRRTSTGNSVNLNNSKILDKEWDLLSEVYERKAQWEWCRYVYLQFSEQFCMHTYIHIHIH